MSSSQLRKVIQQPAVFRSFSSQVARVSPLFSKTVLSNDTKGFQSSARCNFSDERSAQLRAEGVIDEAGFTAFNTLHELRLTSCKAYEEKELFGTFTPKDGGEGSYEWMTYKDFNALVDKTRTVLKNLGKFFLSNRDLSDFQY